MLVLSWKEHVDILSCFYGDKIGNLFMSVLLSDDPDKRMQVFDDTVILFNAKAEDSGVYQCEASNRHGNILANVNIVIMSKFCVVVLYLKSSS